MEGARLREAVHDEGTRLPPGVSIPPPRQPGEPVPVPEWLMIGTRVQVVDGAFHGMEGIVQGHLEGG